MCASCTNLTSIDVSELPKLDDEALIAIASLPSLQYLRENVGRERERERKRREL